MNDQPDKQELPLQESTGRLRALLEAMQDVVLVVAPDGRYVDVAPTRPDLLYRPPPDVLGKTPFDIFPHEQAEFFHRAVQQSLQTGQLVTIEYMLPIAGRDMWFEGRLSPIRDESGRPVAVLLAARDITEQHKTLEALRESEAQYRNLVEQSNDAIYLLVDRRFEFINPRFTEMFGVSQEEARSPDFDFMRLVSPQSRPLIEERDRRFQQGEALSPRYEFTALSKEGREIVVEASVSYVHYHGQMATQGILRDITERKRAEEQLARRSHYLACLADTAQDLLRASDPWAVLPLVLQRLGETAKTSRVYLFENHRDAAGRLLTSQRLEWCSPGTEPQIDNPALQNFCYEEEGFERWVGTLGRGQMIAGRVADFPPSERPVLEAQGIVSILVLPLVVGGSWYGFIGFDVCGTERDWEEVEVNLLATAAHDIAQALERKRTLVALQESEERYRRLIELLPDGVAVHQEGILRMANRTGARLLGYDSPEEIIGRPVLDFVHPDYRSVVLERIRAQLEEGREAPPLEERFLRKDGSAIAVEVSASPFLLGGKPAVLTVVRDITGRKRLEEQLRQAQKMEAIGRLAGGVAHDFNNLLTAINGYAELCLNSMRPDDPLIPEIEAILKAGRRAALLTQQLLAFGRRQVMEMRVVNLNRLVEDLLVMLRRVISEDIELVWLPAPDLGNVRVDPVQMEQVIINLAVNARDAMPGGGRLLLETANADLSASDVRDRTEVTPGKYVLLSVSDTGRGMPPEVRQHVFEPFFTTKEGGTGLGLATVYGIVKQFDGYIHVYSEEGLGTTFRIYLPRTEAEAEPVAGPPPAERPRGSETILVVEDNDMVRNLAVRVLREQGYTVLEAGRSEEAIRLAQEYAGPIHLLLTDVVMPQISGKALKEHLEQAGRPVRVLYMSGYTDNIIARHGILEPGTPFIQKPFTPQALAEKVRMVLDMT